MLLKSLQARIAMRLLTTRRGNSAAGAIALVAVCGVAIATAAIIVVLSVFNGFHSILVDNLNGIAPDIQVSPTHGKTLSADSLIKIIEPVEGVKKASPVLTDNALALYGTREMPVTLRGVIADDFSASTRIDSMMVVGESLKNKVRSDSTPAILAVGTASQLAFYNIGDDLLLFVPHRHRSINLANPAASFVTDSVNVCGVFNSGRSEIDANTIYVDISIARNLFDRPGEASSIDISVDHHDITSVARTLRNKLGDKFIVKDRFEQAELDFRMVQIEKWVSFLMLIFILVIASFNIVSTLTMIVLDRRQTIHALHCIGMSRRGIGNVFFWESCYITFFGGIIGMILGSALCLIQQHYGIIHMAGVDSANAIVTSYPVVLQISDLAITAIPLLIIGPVTGIIASSYARSRIRQ